MDSTNVIHHTLFVDPFVCLSICHTHALSKRLNVSSIFSHLVARTERCGEVLRYFSTASLKYN